MTETNALRPPVGIVVPTVDNSFFSSLSAAANRFLLDAGYTPLILSSGNSAETEKQHLRALAALGVRGILCVSGLGAWPDDLLPESLPLVWVDRRPESKRVIPFVANDDCAAMSEAAEYLIEKGCRNILLMPGYLAENRISPRVVGYEAALKKHGITPDPANILYRSGQKPSEIESEELIRQAMARNVQADAVITSSDRAAFGVITALHRVGLYVPEDVRLISFDNSPYSRMASPAVSALDRRPDLLAEKACGCLLDRIAGKPVPPETIIPVSLIRRDSTR